MPSPEYDCSSKYLFPFTLRLLEFSLPSVSRRTCRTRNRFANLSQHHLQPLSSFTSLIQILLFFKSRKSFTVPTPSRHHSSPLILHLRTVPSLFSWTDPTHTNPFLIKLSPSIPLNPITFNLFHLILLLSPRTPDPLPTSSPNSS